jgi:hypothetical protein
MAPAPPVVSAPVETLPDCCPCQKEVHAVVETVPHTRICYDCKDEDYAYTKHAHTPILTIFCHDHCGKCECNETEPCHDCGHARTRKVLIKIIVTEPVAAPKCKVERVPICPTCPSAPPCTGNVEDMVWHEGDDRPKPAK